MKRTLGNINIDTLNKKAKCSQRCLNYYDYDISTLGDYMEDECDYIWNTISDRDKSFSTLGKMIRNYDTLTIKERYELIC